MVVRETNFCYIEKNRPYKWRISPVRMWMNALKLSNCLFYAQKSHTDQLCTYITRLIMLIYTASQPQWSLALRFFSPLKKILLSAVWLYYNQERKIRQFIVLNWLFIATVKNVYFAPILFQNQTYQRHSKLSKNGVFGRISLGTYLYN